ncbi:Maf-like protein [Clostridium polynesiense]|uniref:Maf-like protein n=1 Tax=Clostridium polynesiense TaxID=1325933 RepID=UPI000590CC3B|nr:Maf-like protein [Clostridium polynesiense]
MKIVLASASLRRQELLKRIIQDFHIVVSNFSEDSIMYNNDPKDYVIKLSQGKAREVSERIDHEALIIGADTVVVLENKIMGKPKDEGDAFNMLKNLSGKWHKVYSGITLINTKDGKSISDYVCTKVKFSHISDEDIQKYINTGEPMDKAGAYGIQGLGGIFVEAINGCYYNVVGFPLNKISGMLKQMV